jgi:hypothetical protein
MSRAGSTTNLPLSSTSDAVAPLQVRGERLSKDATEKVPQTTTENVSEETSDDANTLWVDWDEPGDPMNPKKWVVRLLPSFLSKNDLTTS